ncbi:MAG TPA: hypothetical protein ENG33_11260 [Chloroflexi bacterium]|nr:hypothetical protein [Chloroflexota bacterium]
MAEQLPLLPAQEEKPSLKPSSPLSKAIEGFHGYMLRQGFTQNTIKSFLWDLSLFSRYLGEEHPVGQIGVADLRGFLEYLLYKRGKPCKPKSYARRLTTLKVFFGWLHKEGIIPEDPAAPLPHRPVSTPLPKVLNESQVERLLEAAKRLASGPKPDFRPLLLVRLVLSTGMKKSECLSLRLADIDLSDPEQPAVLIRYENPKMRHKERKLALPPDIVPVLKSYVEQYKPRERLFECTGRNLEYVLHHLAQQAGIPGGLTFEMMRWTAALRDYKAGMPPEKLRRKLGLSRISWAETLEKLEKLAASPL